MDPGTPILGNYNVVRDISRYAKGGLTFRSDDPRMNGIGMVRKLPARSGAQKGRFLYELEGLDEKGQRWASNNQKMRD